MKIVCVGGGPAGLTFSMLVRLWLSETDVTVFERNPRGVTYGWGVVFPEPLLRDVGRRCADTASEIVRSATIWEDQHVHVRGARPVHLGRYGYSIGRATLQEILETRAEHVGVKVRHRQEPADPADFADADLVVAADGANSRLRTARSCRLGSRVDRGRNHYIWLGTRREFGAFTFGFEQTEAGWIWFHAYRYAPGVWSFIVECSPETWQGMGFDRMDAAASTHTLEQLFARYLQGHGLMDQMGALGRAGWQTFGTVTNESWVDGNVVLIGDAAHTAHFSIGSGTLLAMGDALALAEELRTRAPIPVALERYEAKRRPAVAQFQANARNSALWFENVCQFIGREPVDFAYALLNRRAGFAAPEADPGWRYQMHRALQIGFLPDVRRQLLATRRTLRGPLFR